ncbi:MAG: cadherin domain-containing protein, partial [Kiritimatiellae bacterium]|nr:cadherin domain-containing protein [Kiritimatiellia bacterium]
IMAHSMGGLVSRYAMNINTQFASRVHRLVTLGSPHQGSQGANPTWIKYSGPDDDSWFISGIYNTFKLHNNTAGCFDLAWYATNQIPVEALSESAISAMTDTYQPDLLRRSLKNPFCGWSGMVTTNKHDYKMVMFGGSSTNQISDYLSKDWPDEPSGEVKTDHLGLWVATKIFRSMSYADGRGVGDNDGLVPLNSALLTDGNRHPNTAKYNLNATEGQQVDHASYLDVPVTMDSVKAVLLTQVRTYCRKSDGPDLAAARWRLVEPKADAPGPWQKPGVRLPALTPGVTYTIQFKAVDGYNKPADISFTAKKSTTTAVTGTYTTAQETNHAPTGLALSNASVVDGAPAGTLVGALSATDPDANETFTYSLVSGEGDTGNAWFTISGNRLLTARVFDYEEYPAHYCRIQVADHAGATHEEAFTIQIENLPDTPGELSGDAWINLQWDAVEGASKYRVDVTACGGSGTTYALHAATLYTNKFKSGHRWKYILPDGASAPSSTKGAVSNAPIYQTYNGTPSVTAHFLVGTNNIGIQTANFSVNGSPSATLVFTNGAWNGGGVSNRSLLKASYSFDEGVTWTPLGESQPNSSGDNGDVAFRQTISLFGQSKVAFKIEAPNACTLSNYLRGAYVSYAAVEFASATGDFSSSGCQLDGFPVETAGTSYRVSGLPAGTPYWYTVEALVDGTWTSVDSGVKQSVNTLGTPQNLRATDQGSDWLFLEWDPVADADGYVLQVTPVIAGGTPEILSTCPNVQLSSVTNTSGWNYSTNHSVVSSNWFYPMADNPAGDYHALTVKTTPGLQSPVLDLSGYSEASLDFVMRRRGSGGTVWLYWSTDGQTWHESGSVTTNQDMIYNNRIHSLPVPAEALAANVRLELCVTNATGTSTSGGNGVGIKVTGGPTLLENCLIADNTTGYAGTCGGLAIVYGTHDSAPYSKPTILRHCTIVRNKGGEGKGCGGLNIGDQRFRLVIEGCLIGGNTKF